MALRTTGPIRYAPVASQLLVFLPALLSSALNATPALRSPIFKPTVALLAFMLLPPTVAVGEMKFCCDWVATPAFQTPLLNSTDAPIMSFP